MLNSDHLLYSYKQKRKVCCHAASEREDLISRRKSALLSGITTSTTLIAPSLFVQDGQANAPIISGFTPAEGYTVALCSHSTPNFSKWYNSVYSPAVKAVDAKEIGDDSVRSVIRRIVLKDLVNPKEICVLQVFPNE